jgi:energy-coupling factor transporter ATP-binding protein EcfA2
MAKLSKVLQFGNYQFQVQAESEQLVGIIEGVFTQAESNTGRQNPEIICEQLYEPEIGCGDDKKTPQEAECLTITHLLNKLYARHAGCLWIDAATLRAPDGKLVLLAGPSFSGKTTLAMAMALAKQWTIISQDITLIDPVLNVVVPCPAPINIRTGASEMLSKLGHLPRISLGQQGWFFDQSLYLMQPTKAEFTALLTLVPFEETIEEAAAERYGDLSIEQLSLAEFIRSILPYSNLLRLRHHVSTLQDAGKQAQCLRIEGGELKERMELLESLVALPV